MAQYRNNTVNGRYEYGTAARDYSTSPRKVNHGVEERPSKRQAQRKSSYFNFRGFIMMTVAFAIFAATMVNYVKLQSELTGKVKNVARMEIQLNDLETANNEHYSRIISSVDLKEIETVAKDDLGMTYASEGQIITYTSVGNDYMRRVDGDN